MDDAEAIKPEVIDLVVQLCTRVGMMMEDVGPLALDASRTGLEKRVAELANSVRKMSVVVAAAQTILDQ